MENVFETIKARVTLRSVMERDGAVFRRAGSALVCCCPIHGEKTPSCHLHETERGDWFRCFGCDAKGDIFSYVKAAHNTDAKGALEILKPLAGIGEDVKWEPPKREIRVEEKEEPITELSPEDMAKWRAACAALRADVEEIERIAQWRGFSSDLVAWAAEQELVGRVIYSGVWREAFLIERPADGGAVRERIGWHVRLAPRTPGNEHDRASWRYRPRKGLGAWPFLICPGAIEEARWLFILEGQWDALALVELFGWHRKWPAGVAVVGIRGATSWERFLQYRISDRATAFLIGDADKAGEGWFVPKASRAGEPSFSEALGKRVKKVWAYRPNPERGKDFNDIVRAASPEEREVIVERLRRLIKKRKGEKREATFMQWMRSAANKQRAGIFLAESQGRREAMPKPRAQKKHWLRFVEKLSVEAREQWLALYTEWQEERLK